MKIFAVLFSLLVAQVSYAQPWYFGLQYQNANPLSPSSFKDDADSGNGGGALLGYRLTDKWAAELGYDQYKFDKADMTHANLHLSGVYRPWAGFVNPFARLGLGVGENKFDAQGVDKMTDIAGQFGVGAEFNFKPVTLFAGLSWNYLGKLTDSVKEAQSWNAQIGVIFPGLGFGEGVNKEAKVEAAPVAATPAPVVEKVPEDFINKCLNSDAPECVAPGSASVKVEVEFTSGKAVVGSQYYAEIERLAKYMQKYPKTTVQVAGHTDSSGSEKINTAISQKRAAAVKDILVKKYSIPASRITAKGFGPKNPIADNATDEGRAKNRRVEANITIK